MNKKRQALIPVITTLIYKTRPPKNNKFNPYFNTTIPKENEQETTNPNSCNYNPNFYKTRSQKIMNSIPV